MSALLSVAEAIGRILARCRRLPAETTALTAARGRVLAQAIVSDIDLPPFDNSAMDGFAVHTADLAQATAELPVLLPVAANLPAEPIDPEPLPPGAAARIMTGAPMPPGADAVVPVERVTADGDRVAFTAPVRLGANLRRQAEDLAHGDTVLTAGTALGHTAIALLAAVGCTQLPVVRRPRVAVFSTGEELVPAAWTPGPGQVRDSSLFALPAQIESAGAELVAARHALSTERELLAALAELPPDTDLILTAGGVSMGDRDFVRPALERHGTVDFWRVAVKPGKPLLFGTWRDLLFFGLPGNPVSSMVTLDLFVRPALNTLLGRPGGRTVVHGTWGGALRSDPNRDEYARVVATPQADGTWLAVPTGDQSSGRLTSMLGANAYGVIPVGMAEVAPGDPARIELFDAGPGAAS